MSDQGTQGLANDIFKGISGILWFFYRVFFTMVPTALFLILCFNTLEYIYNNNILSNLPPGLNSIINTYQEIDTGNKLLCVIIVTAFLNIILEAVVIRIAYRVLGFESFSAKLFSVFSANNFSCKLKTLHSPVPFYSLMNTHSLMKDPKVFEYIMYLLAREFLFNNTWVLTLCTFTFIVPVFVCNNFNCTYNLAIYFPVQFLASCLIAYLSFWLVKFTKENLEIQPLNESTEYADKMKADPCLDVTRKGELDKYSKRSKRADIINLLTPFVFAIAFYILLSHKPLVWCIVALNLITFILCYYLISAAFREYVSVEAVVHNYYLIEKEEIDKKIK